MEMNNGATGDYSTKFSRQSDKIERTYQELGHTLGWRFLTSPLSTIDCQTNALFLTLNPAGSEIAHAEHRESAEFGSPYVFETWAGHLPGQAPLQQQIQKLYRRLDWSFNVVLSGQLVPFRSPSWAELPRKTESLEFGTGLWKDVIRYVQPRIIVAVGKGQLRNPLIQILGVPEESHDVPVGWGQVTAGLDLYKDCRVVTLPHLSRFQIMGRSQSERGLSILFD
ncbi:MAG: hypothetical protein AB8G18_18365 [Gammaproteobacteria bacterium]